MNLQAITMEPTNPQLRARLRALGTVTAVFALFYVIEHYAGSYLAGFAERIAPLPAPVHNGWIAVLRQLVGSCFTSIMAMTVPVWLYLHLRWRRLRDLGFTRGGTALAWGLVLAVEAYLVWHDIAHGPVGVAPDPLNRYALSASAVVGVTAAFTEEIFFRGYMMDELQRGGFGPVMQVVLPMLLFGLAHIGYLSTPGGWSIMLDTSLLGGFWSIIYLIGGRSLWPTVVAHAINDAVVIPSAFYMMFHAAGH